MTHITPDTIHNLYPILDTYIKEANMGTWTNVGYVINTMRQCLSAGTASVTVDDPNNPQILLWGVVNQSAFLQKQVFHIAGVYIHPDIRGNKDAVVELMNTCENEAKRLNCNMIFGAEWHLLDESGRAGEMWKKSGFSKMETIYSKEV